MATAFESGIQSTSINASGDLSSNQFLFHEIDTSGTLTLATVRGQRVHGILRDDPAASGRPGELVYGGCMQVTAGGTFQEGVAITTNASGQAIEATLLTDSVIGTAVQAGVSGERTTIMVGTAGGQLTNPEMVVVEDFNAYGTTDQVSGIAAAGTAASGTGDVLNWLYAKDNVFAYEAHGTQTITVPVVGSTGLDIGMDQTANDGIQMWSHFLNASGRPFIVGNHAAFYFLLKFEMAALNGTDDFHVGFRRAEISRPNVDDYLDMASMGCTVADGTVDLETIANNGGTTTTVTGDTIVAATATQFKILVSAAGVVTYQHDIAVAGTLAAPTTVAAFTIDDGDPVIPFVDFLQAAAQTALVIHKWEAGFQ